MLPYKQMKIVTLKVSELKPYEKNHRTHPKKQVDLLAKNIERFGFTTPVLIDKNNVVIAGHGRLLALKQLNREEVPCVRMENLSDDEVKALRLADNQIALMGDTDMKLVIPELKELSEELLNMTGFDKDLIIEADENDDVIPENVPSRSKLGDLYELGQHRLLCGDSTQQEAVLRLCGGIKVDMYLTDPPYNVAYVGKTKDALTIDNDKMGDVPFLQFLTDAFKGADVFMKNGAVFYIWHADMQSSSFIKATQNVGWHWAQKLIWVKNTLVMSRQDYHWKHEPCLYGWKEGASHLWNSDRTQTTVLNFDRPSRNESHPTMKPISLISYQITNNTKGDDIILDTFLGSGSTLIACEKTGRICYGMELDPKYVDVIVQRYVDYVDNPVVKCNGQDVTKLWNKTMSKTK